FLSRRYRGRVLRLSAVVIAGVVCWVVSGWPVAAVLAAAGVWWLPGLLGPDRAHAEQVARVEAVAVWTEQVRDLMEGAAGLHQAIINTVPTAPGPIRSQIARLAEDLQQGTPLERKSVV